MSLLPIARRRGREVLCQSRSPDCNPCTPGRHLGRFDLVTSRHQCCRIRRDDPRVVNKV